MDKPEPLTIAAMIADESRELVKVLVIGVRTNGSLMIIDSGLEDEDFDQMYKDFRLWVGRRLGKELTGYS